MKREVILPFDHVRGVGFFGRLPRLSDLDADQRKAKELFDSLPQDAKDALEQHMTKERRQYVSLGQIQHVAAQLGLLPAEQPAPVESPNDGIVLG